MVIIHELKTENRYVKMTFTLTEFDRDRRFVSTIFSGLMKENGIALENIADFATVSFENLKQVRQDNLKHDIDSNDFYFEFDPNDKGNEFKIVTLAKGLSNS
jgi:hypothetical protein